MRIQTSSLGVRCHQIGWLLRGVDLDIGPGVTLLTGPTGSGTSLLINLLSGQPAPQVRQLTGQASLGGVDPTRRTSSELGALVVHVGPDAGLDGLTDALAGRPYVVFVDQLLADLDADSRWVAARRLRSAADEGATVLWADHDLDVALPVADEVIELVDHAAHAHRADQWEPATRPPTIMRTLAARAHLPLASCDDPDAVQRRLDEAGITALSRAGRRATSHNHRAQAIACGLDGGPVEVAAGETLAVVSADPRDAIIAARCLARAAGGAMPDDREIAAMLRMNSVDVIGRRLRRRGLPFPLADIHELVGPAGSRTARAHSPGQRQLMGACLGMAPGGLGLLVEPTRGVDLTGILALARMLRRPREHAVVIASRDIDFVVRVADRVLVVEGNRLVADATPTALLDRLPYRPILARALPEVRAVRHRDLTLIPAGGQLTGTGGSS